MRSFAFAFAVAVLLAATSGCVWRHQYDSLEREHNQLKQQLADVTHHSSTQQASMNGALQTAQGNLNALVAERDALRTELGISQRNFSDIRGRVEQMWTIMQAIMSTLAPTGSYSSAASTPAPLPPPPRSY